MKKTGIVWLVMVFFCALVLDACSHATPASGGKRILYVPLDDRPVNYGNVIDLVALSGYELVYPGEERLASYQELKHWLKNNTPGTKAAVVSLDMLAYGGLVESRKHQYTADELYSRLSLIKELDVHGPVWAFVSIMRTPAANTQHTMPDYFAEYGAHIHKYGVLRDKLDSGAGEPGEKEHWDRLAQTIPAAYLEDFMHRRDTNHRVTCEILKLVQQGFINYLVISSDDTSPYGYSRMEKEKLITLAHRYGISDKVVFFPGTDECGMLLLAAAANHINGKNTKVFVDYGQPKGANPVQPYEDIPLDENVRRHIIAAGAVPVESAVEAGLVLAVHNKAGVEEQVAQAEEDLNGGDNTAPTLAMRIKDYIEAGKPVTVADVMYANGGDPVFLGELDEAIDLSRLAGYAGWNTAGNTIGMALGLGLMHNLDQGKDMHFAEKHRDALLTRLVEDWGYQAVVRPEVKEQVPAEQRQLINNQALEDAVARSIEEKLNTFTGEHLTDFGSVQVRDVKLPWHRLFDIEFTLKAH